MRSRMVIMRQERGAASRWRRPDRRWPGPGNPGGYLRGRSGQYAYGEIRLLPVREALRG
jgi:hypothetical protein